MQIIIPAGMVVLDSGRWCRHAKAAVSQSVVRMDTLKCRRITNEDLEVLQGCCVFSCRNAEFHIAGELIARGKA